MIWFFVALVLLIAAVVLLIRCAVLRKKAHGAETEFSLETGKTETEKATALYKKAKLFLILGIVLLALAEVAILLGSHLP